MSAAETTNAIGYDVATALWQGNRPYQEDTLLADFHGGMERGFAVLADGMGGHAAGDLASRLVVIDAVSHLKFLMHDGPALEANLQAELTSAIKTANDVLKDRGSEDSRLSGMGTTFLATVMFEDRLYWASVGDSPLYLWREGALRQINEDHSMAPVIDQMAKAGEISAEDAANHPDRNALTSVLMGSRIKSMDVPKVGMVLDPGDVLIQASDGLQYLDDARISAVLASAKNGATSREIVNALMGALHDLDDPLQDNTAILVLQLCDGMGRGGGTGVAVGASSAERAVAAAATSAATVTRSATASAPDVAQAMPPRGSRQWVIPAALLGGAAVVLGLFFGFPGGQSDPDVASVEVAESQVATAEADAVDVLPESVTLLDADAPDLNAVAADAPADPDAPDTVAPDSAGAVEGDEDAPLLAVGDAPIAPQPLPDMDGEARETAGSTAGAPAPSVLDDVAAAPIAAAQPPAPGVGDVTPGEAQAESADVAEDAPSQDAPTTAEPSPELSAAEETTPTNVGATILFQNGAGAQSDGATAGVIGPVSDGASTTGIGVLGGAGAGNIVQNGLGSTTDLPAAPVQPLQGLLPAPAPVPLEAVIAPAPVEAPVVAAQPLAEPLEQTEPEALRNPVPGVGPLREGLSAPSSGAAPEATIPLRQQTRIGRESQRSMVHVPDDPLPRIFSLHSILSDAAIQKP